MTRRSRIAASVLSLACAVTLAGCGGGAGSERDVTAPVEVTVGKQFTWNEFTVEDGWKIKGVQRSVDIQDEVTTPEVSGSIVNNSTEVRAAIFQMVFSVKGEAVATVNCSAPVMIEDQSMRFLCPGINTTMPKDYDTVTVLPYTRDTGKSDSGESGT